MFRPPSGAIVVASVVLLALGGVSVVVHAQTPTGTRGTAAAAPAGRQPAPSSIVSGVHVTFGEQTPRVRIRAADASGHVTVLPLGAVVRLGHTGAAPPAIDCAMVRPVDPANPAVGRQWHVNPDVAYSGRVITAPPCSSR